MMTNPSEVTATKSVDAIALLIADHKAVKKLFEEFETIQSRNNGGQRKAHLVKQICDELSIHTQIEEEIFYPAVREAIEDDNLVDEALVEHASAKDLIAQLREMSPGDDLYDAKVMVLSEYIENHVKEEEGEMFLRVRNAGVDTAGLGRELASRKEALKAKAAGHDNRAAERGNEAPNRPRAKAPNGSRGASRGSR